MTHHYCTYFDRNYLARGLTLYRSLQAYDPGCQMSVLCLDDLTFDVVTRLMLPGLHPLALADFEAGDAALLQAKLNRSRVEYYFTCSPALPAYLFRTQPDLEAVTYLDADLYFFGTPAPLFEEIGDASIAIIAHRFPPSGAAMTELFGIYNVGWLTFRRDEQAAACLAWWRQQCLDWCSDSNMRGQYGDQKYLDDWPQRFAGVHVIQHKGANVAPWNLTTYPIRWRHDQVWVDDQSLIFYHFQMLKRNTAQFYNPQFPGYIERVETVVRRQVYAPYIVQLQAVEAEIAAYLAADPAQNGIRFAYPQPFAAGSRWALAQKLGSNLKKALQGRYIFLVRGHAL